MKRTELPVRLMLRVEGEWWNGYLGPAVGRKGAKLLLGSLRLSIAMLNPKRKQDFIDLMSNAMADMVPRPARIYFDWELWGDLAERFRDECERRNIEPAALAADILETVIRDNLFAAVLDG